MHLPFQERCPRWTLWPLLFRHCWWCSSSHNHTEPHEEQEGEYSYWGQRPIGQLDGVRPVYSELICTLNDDTILISLMHRSLAGITAAL
jgi:hypothetical protein